MANKMIREDTVQGVQRVNYLRVCMNVLSILYLSSCNLIFNKFLVAIILIKISYKVRSNVIRFY